MRKLLSRIKAAITGFAVRVKHVFTRVEAGVKTAAASIIGGGVTAVSTEIHQSGHFIVNMEHLLALKASFISGAFVSFVLYLSKFPEIGKAGAQGQLFDTASGK